MGGHRGATIMPNILELARIPKRLIFMCFLGFIRRNILKFLVVPLGAILLLLSVPRDRPANTARQRQFRLL